MLSRMLSRILLAIELVRLRRLPRLSLNESPRPAVWSDRGSHRRTTIHGRPSLPVTYSPFFSYANRSTAAVLLSRSRPIATLRRPHLQRWLQLGEAPDWVAVLSETGRWETVCVCVRQEKSLTSNPLSCTTVTRDGFGDEAKSVTQQSLPGLPTVQFCKQSNAGRWEGLGTRLQVNLSCTPLGCAYGT